MSDHPAYPRAPLPLLGRKTQFILLPQFSSLGLSLLSEPLFLANWLLGEEVYSWRLLSLDGAPVMSSDGQEHAVSGALDHAGFEDALFVLASFEPGKWCRSAALLRLLRTVARRRTLIAGIETGSEALAHAGLLDHRRAAIHWDCQSPMREQYPEIEITGTGYELDGPIATSAGALSNLDLALHLIEAGHGADLAGKIARHLLHRRPAPGSEADAARSGQMIDTRMRQAVALMEAHIEEPLSAPQIARRLNLSQRQLERDFLETYGLAPGRFYRQLRLNRAHRLLQQTTMSVTEIAVAAGFNSVEHFSRAYRAQFGLPPSKDRRMTTSAPASWVPSHRA